ncbi:MAG: hypothetical protein AAFX41_06395, partial [Bacteroidota bacterium]
RTARTLSPERRAVLLDAVRRALSAREEAVQAPIVRLRSVLAADSTPVAVRDYGAGTRARMLGTEAKPESRPIAEIYDKAAASPAWGAVLFRLARALRPRVRRGHGGRHRARRRGAPVRACAPCEVQRGEAEAPLEVQQRGAGRA